MASEIVTALLAAGERHAAAAVAGVSDAVALSLDGDFKGIWAHGGQLPPHDDWRTWVMMAGRGFGKTRAGAEWVLARVRSLRDGPSPGSVPPQDERCSARIALVAATVEEARAIMVEGRSGLLALARAGEIEDWQPSLRTVRFKGGATATLFSGASPESLRGPEHHFAWCDELAKWRHPQATWDMLQLGLRLGARPRAIVTTTPRGGGVLTGILEAPDTLHTGGASHDNPHLPGAFLSAIEASYGGTRLGRQEIGGELLPDVAGALWTVELLEGCRESLSLSGERSGEGTFRHAHADNPLSQPSPLKGRGLFARIVIGVDPPSGDGTCGIVACARSADGRGAVLGDHSVSGRSPEGWARAVAAAVEAHGAHAVIAEGNQGGAMVEAVLRAAGVAAPVTLVRATVGKSARADPVATLFEAGRVSLHGRFALLEAELCGLIGGGGYAGPGLSPDRAEAMVWALTDLMLGEKPQVEPRIRVL